MAIRIDDQDGVRTLTIARPQAANALDATTRRALAEAVDAVGADGIRTVILTGAGDRAFCAGMDVRDVPPVGADEAYLPARIAALTVPVIAAVNGAAVGGGFELVLACDLVVAATHATFGLPEVRRGIAATDGGMALPQRIPMALALEIGLTGEPIDARRAHALGLVNRVVDADALLPSAHDLARRIVRNAPLAVAWTKRLMRDAVATPREDLEATARAATQAILASDDVHEGTRAFLDKREPRWRGR